jgi:hypothetical protein
MITRSLFYQRPRRKLPAGQRRSPVVGPRHKDVFLRCGGARCPGPSLGTLGATRDERRAREQTERVTQSNNYWSATSYVPNPNNAWNVNFNNGNINNNNKTNDNYVRAVRGGW